jgi:hypothetical protein
MRIVDFAEMLRDSINDKINECRDDIHKSHNHIDKDSSKRSPEKIVKV